MIAVATMLFVRNVWAQFATLWPRSLAIGAEFIFAIACVCLVAIVMRIRLISTGRLKTNQLRKIHRAVLVPASLNG